MARASSPAGASDPDMLLWHFRSRRAALAVERLELARHLAALRRAHFAHVVSSSMPPGVSAARQHTALAYATCQLHSAAAAAAAASPLGGGCSCVGELEMGAQCMAALQAAQADVAARVARIEAGRQAGGVAGQSASL